MSLCSSGPPVSDVRSLPPPSFGAASNVVRPHHGQFSMAPAHGHHFASSALSAPAPQQLGPPRPPQSKEQAATWPPIFDPKSGARWAFHSCVWYSETGRHFDDPNEQPTLNPADFIPLRRGDLNPSAWQADLWQGQEHNAEEMVRFLHRGIQSKPFGWIHPDSEAAQIEEIAMELGLRPPTNRHPKTGEITRNKHFKPSAPRNRDSQPFYKWWTSDFEFGAVFLSHVEFETFKPWTEVFRNQGGVSKMTGLNALVNICGVRIWCKVIWTGIIRDMIAGGRLAAPPMVTRRTRRPHRTCTRCWNELAIDPRGGPIRFRGNACFRLKKKGQPDEQLCIQFEAVHLVAGRAHILKFCRSSDVDCVLGTQFCNNFTAEMRSLTSDPSSYADFMRPQRSASGSADAQDDRKEAPSSATSVSGAQWRPSAPLQTGSYDYNMGRGHRGH